MHFRRHDALLLLCPSFAIPKILYLLRMSPCLRSTKLLEFDLLLRSIVSKVINVNLSDDDVWCQASLPVSSGGIGICSAVQLASSAFLALAAGCKALSSKILPPRLMYIVHNQIKKIYSLQKITCLIQNVAYSNSTRAVSISIKNTACMICHNVDTACVLVRI